MSLFLAMVAILLLHGYAEADCSISESHDSLAHYIKSDFFVAAGAQATCTVSK
jgi:hypothetical protein